MSGAGVVVDRPASGVTRIRLDRPDRRNAVDLRTALALHDAVVGAMEPVVLASTSSVFCAGADLTVSDEERRVVSDALHRCYVSMASAAYPVIAAVGGAAVGGGAQLALAADLRVAGPDGWFRFPGAGHGLAVGAWGLPSLVGRGRAIDLCLTMRRVEVQEALDLGLVDVVADDPEAAAVDLAASADPAAKVLVGAACGTATAIELERRGNAEAWNGSVAGLSWRSTGTST